LVGAAVGAGTSAAVQYAIAGQVNANQIVDDATLGGLLGLASPAASLAPGLRGLLSRSKTGGQTGICPNPNFEINPRVLDQLRDPRMGTLAGKLTADDLQRLANNPAALRVLDARTGNINVIQDVGGQLVRITVPSDAMKIISVGPIQTRNITNSLERGDFVRLP
jgi:hypothetical protein